MKGLPNLRKMGTRNKKVLEGRLVNKNLLIVFDYIDKNNLCTMHSRVHSLQLSMHETHTAGPKLLHCFGPTSSRLIRQSEIVKISYRLGNFLR